LPRRVKYPTSMIAMGVIAAGTIAAGSAYVMKMKKERDTRQKVQAARAFRYRNAYRSIRNPGYTYLSDDDVKFHGNRNTRDIQLRNAKYRWSNHTAYRSSIWDLEQFLR
jgi:myosin-crossreactive antigen